MTQELRWKSNKAKVAARAFTLMRLTDLPDGSQKIELMPDLKTGALVEVYVLDTTPINRPPNGGDITLTFEVPAP